MKNRYKRKLIFVIAILSLSLVCCKSKTEPINNIASWTLDDGWTINGKDEIWYFGFSKNKVLFCAKLLDENAESEFETTMRTLKLIMIKVQIRMIRITKKVILTGKLVVEGTSYVFEFKTFEVKIPVDEEYPDILDYMDSIEVTDYSKNNFPEIGSRKIVTKNHWKNDHIKTADPARSAVFLCVYEREKHTSIIK